MSQESSIKLKLHKTCGLFRCLICWRYILPDDNVDGQGDGYVHRVCKEARQKTIQEQKAKLDYSRAHAKQINDNMKKYFRKLRNEAIKVLGQRCEKCGGKANLVIAPNQQFMDTNLPEGIDRYRDVVKRAYIYCIKCRSCFAKEHNCQRNLPQFNK